MMKEVFIRRLGNSLLHWTNYICAVNREAILNEGSIKYGISEFLEVAKNEFKRPNRNLGFLKGVPRVIDYQFEYSHPLFNGKTVDLLVEMNKPNDSINKEDIYFEFKYIHNKGIDSDELKRYIADVFRLYALSLNNLGSCYFILLSSEYNFDNRFYKDIQPLAKNDENEIDDYKRRDAFLHMLFDHNCLESYPVKVSDLNGHLVKNPNPLESFHQDYIYRQRQKIKGKSVDGPIINISPDDKIYMKRLYPESIDKGGTNMCVYIWQICRDLIPDKATKCKKKPKKDNTPSSDAASQAITSIYQNKMSKTSTIVHLLTDDK